MLYLYLEIYCLQIQNREGVIDWFISMNLMWDVRVNLRIYIQKENGNMILILLIFIFYFITSWHDQLFIDFKKKKQWYIN